MLPDMFPSPLYPVHLCFWTGIERELEIKDVYVGDAAQHEPGHNNYYYYYYYYIYYYIMSVMLPNMNLVVP